MRLPVLSEELRAYWLRAQRLPSMLSIQEKYERIVGLTGVTESSMTVTDNLQHQFAGWAVAAGARCVVHRLRPPVLAQVQATTLAELPDALPALMDEAWILEPRCPERGEALFGDCVSLAGFRVRLIAPALGRGAVPCRWLIGTKQNGGVRTVPWPHDWALDSLAVLTEMQGYIPPEKHTGHAAWVREAVRFAVVFGILLEAERTPLRTDDAAPRGGHRGANATRQDPAVSSAWVTRHVYLRADPVPPATPSREPAGTGPATMPADRVALDVRVRGHLRHQPCGPGHRERRWVYVAAHTSVRWGTTRPIRVEVHAERKGAP